jgi:hypothetical protein
MSLARPIRSAELIRLTPKQSNIYTWGFQPEARFRTAVCGRRFGKTYLAAREMKRALRLAAQRGIHPDNEIWYGAPTFKQAKRVFWQRLKRAIPRDWIDGKPNDSECSIRTVTGHTARIVGLDNYDNLRGSGLYFFVGDEWADAQPECWTEVIQPMLSTCEGHALKIGTPKGFDHFYDAFQAGQPGASDKDGAAINDNRSWHYTTIQGGNVPASEIARARRDLDARTFDQEYEAAFVTYSGRVLHAFNRAGSVVPCPYDPALGVHVGMDFNVNPMSATIWQERGDLSFQVGEIVIPTSNTHEMADEITRRYSLGGAVGHITIHPDPAGAQRRTSAQGKTDISILRERGFVVLAMTSHPLVRDRVNAVNGRFCSKSGERRLFVDPKCVQSITAYERLVYKAGTSDPDKEGGFDHLCDASGYYVYGRFSYKPTRTVQVNHMGR